MQADTEKQAEERAKLELLDELGRRKIKLIDPKASLIEKETKETDADSQVLIEMR